MPGASTGRRHLRFDRRKCRSRYPNNQRQASTEIGNGDLLKPRPALGTPLRNEAADPATESARQALDEGFA
ncbi:hypothetical protein D6C67_24945, partial [Escherichia coli]